MGKGFLYTDMFTKLHCSHGGSKMSMVGSTDYNGINFLAGLSNITGNPDTFAFGKS
jgi:hypothetical protein